MIYFFVNPVDDSRSPEGVPGPVDRVTAKIDRDLGGTDYQPVLMVLARKISLEGHVPRDDIATLEHISTQRHAGNHDDA